jgi:hypothetical protein
LDPGHPQLSLNQGIFLAKMVHQVFDLHSYLREKARMSSVKQGEEWPLLSPVVRRAYNYLKLQ